MKKKIFKMFILILITALLIKTPYSIAKSGENGFFTVNENEISQGETLKFTFDLSQIDYDQFIISLASSVDTSQIEVENSEVLEIEKASKSLTIEVNKTAINLSEINLSYEIPQTIKIGTKLEFVAQIIVYVETEVESETVENTQTEENVVVENIAESNTNTVENEVSNETTGLEETQEVETEIKVEEQVVEEESQVITIVEKSEENEENEKDTLKDKEEQESQDKMSSFDENEMSSDKSKMQNMNDKDMNMEDMDDMKSSSSMSISSSLSGSSLSEEETAVYNGSSNNYLSNLSIDGVTLNTTFYKENTNYFATVQDATSINIIATSEDSDATVCITGADSLVTGENKVLVSVTAENGNVRYYRIYITKVN